VVPPSFSRVQAENCALLVTEAELIAATSNAQDIIYLKRLLESVGLKFALPMLLESDDQGTVDLVNYYSVGGHTRHMETRQYYSQELKEQGVMVVKCKPGTGNSSDLYTKNLARNAFEKHARAFVGNDKYMSQRA